MRTILFDVEANKLENPDVVHCICTKCYETGEEKSFYGDTLPDAKESLESADVLVGHNIIGYDLPVLKGLLGIQPKGRIYDTLIMSKLYKYNISGGHSLRAWGVRLNLHKGDFAGPWDSFTPLMLSYCINDVEVTARLWDELLLRMPMSIWRQVYDTEMGIAKLMKEASTRGFYFNKEQADIYHAQLTKEIADIDEKVVSAFPPKVIVMKTKTKFEAFNPNSNQQVIDQLRLSGWKPRVKTDGHVEFLKKKKPSPAQVDGYLAWCKDHDHYQKYGWKLDEENVATVPENAPEGLKLIILRRILATRLSKLDEWSRAYDPKTGAIHGYFDTLGTWSHRMAHQRPNMGNISNSKSIKFKTKNLYDTAVSWGGKFRALWIARPDYCLVGTDMEGVQLRVLAALMDDAEFTFAVTSGNKDDKTDPHSMNQKRLGEYVCRTRDIAKTYIYCFLLGGGDRKIAEILNIPVKRAAEVKESFIKSYPGLAKLKKEVIPNDAQRGYMVGFDGRRIRCDSEHLMMAAYLQSGEAILVKMAACIADQEITRFSIPAYLINVVHDELIYEVEDRDGYPEMVKLITEQAIYEAGQQLKLKCSMKGDGKIGGTWEAVH